MPSADICLAKAQECDLLADEVADRRLALEWRWMAQEWRLAATDASNSDAPEPAAESRSR